MFSLAIDLPETLFTVSAALTQGAAVWAFLRWALRATDLASAKLWFVLASVPIMLLLMLFWHAVTPDALWQNAVSPGPASGGHRSWSLNFWLLGLIPPMLPMYAMRSLMTRPEHRLSVPQLQVAFAHWLSVFFVGFVLFL